ncbi:hypothetical protein LF817_06270 [Halobacillus sp. A1]|uniref:hypothetical protein n=1 Tax=Halobacillus sp. A1 TaxID=2880262 RepID=UPI0020A62B1A|nr:hypothetical protein [Halobacillus sp. A1]MCP3030946.1 hypothetical protein [Halobacillus sp. A1]
MQRKLSVAGWLLFLVGVGLWLLNIEASFEEADSVLIGLGAILLLFSGIMKMKDQQD